MAYIEAEIGLMNSRREFPRDALAGEYANFSVHTAEFITNNQATRI